MSETFESLSTMPVRRIWDGVVARVVNSELITMAVVEIGPNGTVPPHEHHNEQLGFVISGSLTFTVGGETQERGPGDTWRILAGVPHQVHAGPQGAVVAEVYSPVREDWAALPGGDPQPPSWPEQS